MTAPASSGIRYVGLTVSDARRSADWYLRLLGWEEIKAVAEPDGRLREVQLHHRPSDTTVGLIQHAGSPAPRFDETRAGLDHLEVNVPTREDLVAWIARLDALGIAHSPLEDRPSSQLVTFRDPDHIQLEFYWRKRG